MGTNLRYTPVLVLAGVLVLDGASAARAQDTTGVRADTSEYRSYRGADTSAAAPQDTGWVDGTAGVYMGQPTDTTMETEPDVQTGPAAGDTSDVGEPNAMLDDALVCKDGSNAARTDGCVRNGGIDWAATEAATKARVEPTTGRDTSTAAPSDRTAMPRDTTRTQ
jgi:hypothetical protein